jgi:hypothetical protein
MKIISKTLVSAVAIAALQGCAHSHTGGTILHVEEDGTAHACINKEGVKLGDKLQVYNVACAEVWNHAARTTRRRIKCEKGAAGEVTVVEVSDEHFSLLKPVAGTTLQKGQVVEKSK